MTFFHNIIVAMCAILVAHMASAYSLRENPAFASLFPARPVEFLKYGNVTGAQLWELYKTGEDLLIFDVREANEFANGHIPSASNVPLSSIDTDYKIIPKDAPYVFIHCQGGVRSLKAIGILETYGYNNLINVSDGILGWINAGGEIVKESSTSTLALALEAMNLDSMPTEVHSLFF